MSTARAPIGLALMALATAGCYESIALGYANRLVGQPTGHALHGQWLWATDETLREADTYAGTAKFELDAGPWGFRFADVFGVQWTTFAAPAFRTFIRPGFSPVVAGIDEDGRDKPPPWVGVGAELDGGVMLLTGEETAVEIGAHVAGDVGWSGLGTGLYAGIYLGFGWSTKFDLDLVTD